MSTEIDFGEERHRIERIVEFHWRAAGVDVGSLGVVVRKAKLLEWLDEIGRLTTLLKDAGDRASARDIRQHHIFEWCAAAFGMDHATSTEQRGLRLVEEAAEAAQAAGCNPETLRKIIDYVYSRPAGELQQELGGVGLCVLAMAASARFSADIAENAECARVMAKPLSFFAERNRVKNNAGFVADAWKQPLPAPPSPVASATGHTDPTCAK